RSLRYVDRSGDGGPPPAADGSSEPVPADELALRRLLRDSVRGIEPSPEALVALQRAVPARRRRRRRLMTAATTVAVLAVGAPVTLHAASVVDANTRTVGAGSDRAAGDGNPETAEIGDRSGSPSDGGGGTRDEASAGEETSGPGTDPETGGPTEPGRPDSTRPEESDGTAGSYPRCDRDQLGDAAATLADPDTDGVIYGAIRVSNISSSVCRVRGTDELTATAVRNTTAANVTSPQVVLRTSGDRAVHLPLPDRWVEELVLPPGEAYEIRFAWVPSRGATDGGCSVPEPEPLPADTGSGAGSSSGGSNGGSSSGGAGGGSDDETETGAAAQDVDPDGSGDDPHAPDDDGPSGGSGSGGGGSGGAGKTSGGSTDGTGGGSGSSGAEPGPGPGGPGGAEAEGVLVRYTPASGTPRAAQIELVGVCTGSLHRTGVLVPTV
ncbi:hypothetical protein, partial [Streptomyces spiramenti]